MRHITTSRARYRIRGNWTAAQLRSQYRSFTEKYGHHLSLDRWLVERGKIYFKVSRR